MLGAAFIYQLAWAWLATVPQILGTVTTDDTFLYLEFARNTVAFGFPTFDGVSPTNGVQPLWGGMLVLLASLVQDKILLLRTALTLCAILNAGTGLLLIGAAARLKSPVTVLVVGICWTCYMLGLSPSMLGMENSLHAFIAALVLLCLVRLYMLSTPPSWRQYLLLGVLLALNAGARLDSAVLSIVLGVVVIGRGAALGTRWRQALWPVFGPMALAASGFCLANKAYFGIALPVSGLAKAFYADRYLESVSPWLWPVYVLGVAVKTLFAAPQWLLVQFAPEGVESAVIGVLIGLIAIPLMLRVAAPRLVDQPAAGSPLGALCRVLLVATTLHLVVLSFSIFHFSLDAWYHSWLLIAWMVWLGWALERWWRSPVLPGYAVHGLLGGLVLAVVLCQGLVVGRQLKGAEVQDIHIARLRLSDWLNDTLPPATRLGSWNAGILAYFTDQTFVNLDGLMNSPEYVGRIRSGGNIRSAIDTLMIDVVIDYNTGDSTLLLSQDHDRENTFRGVWHWDEITLLHVQPVPNGRDLCVVELRVAGDSVDEKAPNASPGFGS